ncbi:MAG: Rieske 2Fe-2S domain-containing protein [Alphaproteobacteria bacterium]|nr:Rieske 2Fe-2S domain-containing protein [Alphaproteobacteria bacterium]
MAITNEDIPRVGPETPSGQWLRRYWMPVGLVSELYDIPQAVKIMDEELVLFRDGEGRIGLLGQHCAHRGASLEYGDIESAGIRCPYHGWLYDVDGKCLEQPSEKGGNPFCAKVRQVSYPVRELGGLIFAYMGPNADNPPPLPNYSPLIDHGGIRQIEPIRHFDYNWFNFYENSADPVHVWILHGASAYGDQTWGDRFFSADDPPDFEPVETPYGMKIVMSKPAGDKDGVVVDEMSLGFPSILQVGDTEFVHGKEDPQKLMNKGSDIEHFMFMTPKDDHSFMMFTVDYYTGPDKNFFEHLKEMRKREEPKDDRKPYDKRPLMPFRGNVRAEDIVTQGTQKLVGERQEHLGTSDRGVIMLRKMVRDAIAATAEGKDPKALHLDENAEGLVKLDSFVGVRAE